MHARPTEEALRIDDAPLQIDIEGLTSGGDRYSGTVFVPEAYTYLLMKLHAYHDQRNKEYKGLGRHHALDAYAIVGMMTEEEYDRAKLFGQEDRDSEPVRKVRQIIAEDFGSDTALGMLRVREHPLFRPEFETAQFIVVLKEIFAG